MPDEYSAYVQKQVADEYSAFAQQRVAEEQVASTSQTQAVPAPATHRDYWGRPLREPPRFTPPPRVDLPAYDPNMRRTVSLAPINDQTKPVSPFWGQLPPRSLPPGQYTPALPPVEGGPGIGGALSRIGHGLGAIGSAIAAKWHEAVPRPYYDAQTGAMKMTPWRWPFRTEDAISALHATDRAVQDFETRVFQPLIHGRLGEVAKVLYEEPEQGLNLLPMAGSFAKAGRGLATALPSAALEAVSPGASQIAKGVAQQAALATTVPRAAIAEKISNLVKTAPVIGPMMGAGRMYRVMTEALQKADDTMRQRWEAASQEVMDAYAQLPPDLQRLADAALRLTDQTAIDAFYNAGTHTQQVERFRAAVRALNARNAELLRNTGLLSPEEETLVKWGGSFLAKKELPWTFSQLRSNLAKDKALQRQFNKHIESLKEAGYEADYVPIMYQTHATRVLKQSDQPLAGVVQLTESEIPEFAQARKAAKIRTTDNIKSLIGKAHVSNPALALHVRNLEVQRYFAIRDALEKIAANPVFQSAKTEWPTIDTGALLSKAAISAGLPAAEVKRFYKSLPPELKSLKLPPAFHRVFFNMLETQKSDLWDKANSMFKRTLLGADLLRTPVQFSQNASMYAISSDAIRHPIMSFMALVLAFTKEGKELVPLRATQPFRAAIGVKEKISDPAGFIAHINNALDANLRLTNEIADNPFRRAQYIYEVWQATKRMSLPAQGMLDRSSTLLTTLQRAARDPKIAAQALEETNRWWTDFRKLPNPIQVELSRHIMFFPWLRQSANFLKTALVKRPEYVAMLNMMSQAAPSALQPEWLRGTRTAQFGAVPLYDAEGQVVYGPNSMPLLYMKPGMLPFMTTIVNLQQILGMLDADAMGNITLPLGWAPTIHMAAGIAHAIDPVTRQAWELPSYQRVGDQFVRREKLRDKLAKRERLTFYDFSRPTPLLTAIMRPFFPRLWDTLQNINMGDAVPTVETIPFLGNAPAYRSVGTSGQAVKKRPFPPIYPLMRPLGVHWLTPTELNLSPRDELNMYERWKQEAAWKDLLRGR